MPKVVYNSTHGGFALSKIAAMWLAARGHEEAVRWLADDKYSDWSNSYFYAHGTPRHHPLLVECVETLGGDVAGGKFSILEIAEVNDLYIIEEYDGDEAIVQPHDMKWISSCLKPEQTSEDHAA